MHTTLLVFIFIIILRCLTTECQTESSTESLDFWFLLVMIF